MWWNSRIFGWESYHVVIWFLTYSILGWIVESCYMSFCNRKPTNRGFTRGPMCPIYGVGAISVYLILQPFSDNLIQLFFMGSLVATMLELATALIMRRLFGEIWWDYRDKPFNFQGILCLESSIAWGFYTICLFVFLQKFVESIANRIPYSVGKIVGTVTITIYIADFAYALYVRQKTENIEEVYQQEENLIKIGKSLDE